MKRTSVTLLGIIITILCGDFIYEKVALASTKANAGFVSQLTPASPWERLQEQFKKPLKGRPFQELVELSGSLNIILFCDTLNAPQRADLLSRIMHRDYSEMMAMVSEVDRCILQRCDSPCFDAIQDSIIYSSTDETLDVYWHYETQGQDTVLRFNMAAYKRDHPELYFLEDLTTNANMLEWDALITAFAASAQQSPQLDGSIYQATFKQIYAMGFIVGLNDGNWSAQQLSDYARQTAGMTLQEVLAENYQYDLPKMDLLGLTKRIYNTQEFYDLITGDQKDFGFLFMLKGYEAAIRLLGCDDLIRGKYHNNQQEIIQECQKLYAAVYSSCQKSM